MKCFLLLIFLAHVVHADENACNPRKILGELFAGHLNPESAEVSPKSISMNEYIYRPMSELGLHSIEQVTYVSLVKDLTYDRVLRGVLDIPLETAADFRIASFVPEHQKALDFYYETLRNQREFSEERIQMFQKIEKEIPLYRQKFFELKNLNTAERLGFVRIIDSSAHMLAYERKIFPEKHIVTLKQFLFEDQNYLSAYERSLKVRGAHSPWLTEFRSAYPLADVAELGRAYRKPGSKEGEYVKALWELFICGPRNHSQDWDTYFLIHTDLQGAIHFKRSYGALVHEKVIVNPQTLELEVKSTTEFSKTDPQGTEYALMLNSRVFEQRVIESFSRDPIKIKLVQELPGLQNLLDQVKTHLEANKERRTIDHSLRK